ncbi:24800_t:CDS:1, partial [Racocetra persica]
VAQSLLEPSLRSIVIEVIAIVVFVAGAVMIGAFIIETAVTASVFLSDDVE